MNAIERIDARLAGLEKARSSAAARIARLGQERDAMRIQAIKIVGEIEGMKRLKDELGAGDGAADEPSSVPIEATP